MAEQKEQKIKEMAVKKKTYTASELSGLTVAHDLDMLIEGQNVMLLKDKRIDEDDGSFCII